MSCFSLTTRYTEISNNKYIFNNDYTIDASFGLFANSGNNYLIKGVPYNYPLTFFSQANDISNILRFEPINNEPIIIYVSKGQDISFNNNDYFRFYDISYQLLNINHAYKTVYDSSLTDVKSNFYFMNNRSYKFIAIKDFCSNFPFIITSISGNLLGEVVNYSLIDTNTSFTIKIPTNADNSANKLVYKDNTNTINGNLYILRDNSGLKHYYGDISYTYIYNSDTSNIRLSIKSFDFNYGNSVPRFGNKEISNNNFLYYSPTCNYIISNNLANNNEFLNIVSALDISLASDGYKLSFNKNRHSATTTNVYDLSFGLGKGSYIIIDVSQNFPIRLINKDISNLIAIDTTYQPNRIGSITKTIANTNITYYYGSFKVQVFNNFSKVDIELLDNSNLNTTLYTSKFMYTDLPHISGGTYGSVGTSYLNLLNQQDNYYSYNDSTLPSNIYYLNLDKNYIEKSYSAADKYGHNLNVPGFIKTIPPSVQSINQEIMNNITNGTYIYNILYSVTDYENITIQNIRTISINSGPIIEISSTYFESANIYRNNNQYNNVLLLQNNTFNQSYNFFNNINVYIFDISRRRINIPFEISISGNYYNNKKILTPLINNTFFSYSVQEALPDQRILRFGTKNHYAYYNNFVSFRATNTDTIKLRNYVPSSVVIDNSKGVILTLPVNNSIVDICRNTNIITLDKLRTATQSGGITLSRIDKSFDSSSITLHYNTQYNKPGSNVAIDLSCCLKLNNYFFELSLNSVSDLSDNVKITGRFNPINFFDASTNSLIDISFVGSYSLNITTKSLLSGDYFYDTFKSIFFKQSITDISRAYNIIIQDISSPVLTFYNKQYTRYDTSYIHYFPRIRPFNILQDICFVNLKSGLNLNSYISNKPLIQYSDDSIYDFSYSVNGDISYTLVRSGVNSTNINYNNITHELSLNTISSDSSCIIIYRAKDICNNYSQDISLILNFANIPYAELSGNAILTISYRKNDSYIDAGINIYNTAIPTNFRPREISSNIINEISNITINTIKYDICYNTDLSLNVVGNYSFNYIITISNSTTRVPLNLTRLISIKDNSAPYFLFRDFSSINYRLTDDVMKTYDVSKSSSYPLRDISIIDFSFALYRSFDDLSKVLYDFDVSDNYLRSVDMLRTIYLNTNTSAFTYNDISNYFYSSADKRLIKVTKSNITRNVLPTLQFKYIIDGSYGNSATIIRKVDIVDYSAPTIEFSFNNYYRSTGGYNYVYFGASNRDFSYVALDYTKNYSLGEISYNFIQELSSILFNFDLSDNLDLKSELNYQITISNSSIKTSIRNVRELSDNNAFKSLFSKKDTSFILIYDISDNQNNYLSSTRNVKIIDISTNLDISFLNNSSYLTISFGDTNFNIFKDVSFTHKRLSIASISFDISYSFTNTIITSVSGVSPFDISALIYNLGPNYVNYFPKSYSSSFFAKTRTIDISNRGPLISFPGDISHEIYTPLSDASLIFDVTSISIYDTFFFANNYKELSYNGTNFKVTFDNCLNILEPSSGYYNIYYISTDLCGVTTKRTRILNVADTRPPILTICGDFYYELSGDSYYIPDTSIYYDYGAYAYDAGTRTYDISIIKVTKQKIITPNVTYVTISNEILTSNPLIYNRASSSSIYPDYKIIYTVFDRLNNSQDICRNIFIKVSRKPKLYPYIEVSNNNGLIRYPLWRDVSIVTQLRNNIATEDIFYDLSLVFKYDTTIANNQTIICEAIKPSVFNRNITKNYVKFVLEANNYTNDVSLARSLINVDYEPIQSLNLNLTQKIYFYARDLSQPAIDQMSFLEYNLNFIDKTYPEVKLLSNRNFNNIYDLSYPLLSANSIIDLSLNINNYASFNNLYNNYENYYTKSLNYIVLYDPGIVIKDIVDGEVNYINNSFQKIGDLCYNFLNSDISINYYKNNNGSLIDGSLIDVCNILFDGCSNNFIRKYKKRYTIRDRSNNYNNTFFRHINVSRFPPFINLNYQNDCCNNRYITYYHNIYEKYNELKGKVIDYYDGFALSFENVIITNSINENNVGAYTVKYDISNSANIYNSSVRKVNVINTLPLLQQHSYDFNNILNFNFSNQLDSSYNKYSLYNGIYKFDVSENKAFNIRTQEFDICNGIYDISNVVSVTSESSYNTITNKKFYYNNVTLTVSGDFNKLSFELINNAIYPNIAVYDSQNTYINMYDIVYNNEHNVALDSSYIVNIVGLNDPNTKPYFEFSNITGRDLHLSVGNYRFYQIGNNNFYNPIKFSITKDGIHNGGVEYTKNIFRRNLPGVSILNKNSSYVQINIDATTPAMLYYYCDNFPNMGGKIELKNNIIFSKKSLTLNNYVIDYDTENIIFTPSYINSITDEVLKNRVILTQKFNILGGDTSYVNIICITQRNIQHNMLYSIKQHPYKLIIKKHESLSARKDIAFLVNDYSIMKDNTENYLAENNGSSYTFNNTYINFFKYEFDTSLNNLKRQNGSLPNVYDEDIRPIFYNYKNYNYFTNNSNHSNQLLLLNEILNYSDFFRKNNLTKTLLAKDFNYKISNFFFVNPSKLLNLDNNNEYNYIDKLLAPRIKITNITGNYLNFRLEIYYNNKNSWFLSNADSITNKEVLFGTYDFIIYSDILTQFLAGTNRASVRDFVTFYNGSITITNNLIYSYNEELSNNYYNSQIFSSLRHDDLNNTIFLNINDVNNSNSVCGLTKKNLYNNVFFDQSQTLIFHKFDEQSVVNYQVNSPTLRLIDTLNEQKNNDNYLIDIIKSNNDIYNFFDKKPLNFNTLRDLSYNEEYNVYIAFAINDELSTSNSNLALYNIDSIYLNNIPIIKTGYIYRQYSEYVFNSYYTPLNTLNEISYNDFSNKLYSHSYIIDLNDYFDINIFKDTLTTNYSYLTDFINVDNLKYTLLDLKCTRQFNLYDLSNSESVIFNATNLNLLLTMRNKVFPLYFKLKYMINILILSFPNTIKNNVTLNIRDDDSINYYINLLEPDPLNVITNVYTNNVSIYRLNRLYQEIFNNTKLLLANFDAIIKSYNTRHGYLVDISDFLNMVIDFKNLNVDYLNNTILLLESNIENIIYNILSYCEQTNINESLKLYNFTSNITLYNNILTYDDIGYLEYCFKNFYVLNNDLDLMRKEVEVRNSEYRITFESYKNEIASNTTEFSQRRYKNNYSMNNLDATKLYNNLKYNFNLLNNNFILDYSYVLYNYANVTHYYSPREKGTNNVIDFQAYNDASIVNYKTLYTNVNNLYNNITNVFTVLSNNYINKPTIYVNTQYEFAGSKLLINSYYSNSIAIKFNIKYKKSLYEFIDLSIITLDITIPDLVPPTIIFNNSSDISFNENEFKYDASMNELINTKLIDGLSYIDLNQSYSITYSNAIYYDNSSVKQLRKIDNNSLLEIDFTDLSAINFDGSLSKIVTIKYNIVDNANNKNIIRRKITLINDNIEPLYFYNKSAYFVSSPLDFISPLQISELINENVFISLLRNAVTILNPKLIELRKDLFTLQEPPNDLSFIDISFIQIVSELPNAEEVIVTYTINNSIGEVGSVNYQGIYTRSFYGLIEASNNAIYIKYYSSQQYYDIQGVFKIKLQINREPEVIATTIIDTHCCYPKIEYKPIQDNYKLGSQNSTAMRMAKYLINRRIQ